MASTNRCECFHYRSEVGIRTDFLFYPFLSDAFPNHTTGHFRFMRLKDERLVAILLASTSLL